MKPALHVVLTATVVLLIAMMAIPVLISCGCQPKPEDQAVANLRTINTAEITYKSMSSSGGSYGTLSDLIEAKLLDDTFSGTKAGYNYTITLDATGSGYTAEAEPASSKNGRYGYYSVPDAVVRYSTNISLAPAGQSGRSVQ